MFVRCKESYVYSVLYVIIKLRNQLITCVCKGTFIWGFKVDDMTVESIVGFF